MMKPEEINALLHPEQMFILPDRPGLWEFLYNDGRTAAIPVDWTELEDETKVLEPRGQEWPDMTLLDFIGLGKFGRLMGPLPAPAPREPVDQYIPTVTPDRPGLWTYQLEDGEERTVCLHWSDTDSGPQLLPVEMPMDRPYTIEEFYGPGRFIRFLGE